MKTIALIEKGKDGRFGIFTPDIKATIIGEGATVAEAKADFENSLKEVREMFDGDMPGELKDIEFEYKFDIASIFDYFDWINVSKVAKKLDINPSLMRHYKGGKTYISEAQAQKIESGLHKLGSELLTVSCNV